MLQFRGDSINEESSKAKREMKNEKFPIGNKVDCRVCTQDSNGKVTDLIKIEFARSHSDKKFHDDHRKLLREGKTIVDHFYASPFLTKRAKRNVAANFIQIVGTEGKVNKIKLVDNGLNVANKLGSLRLPSSGLDMRKARTLIERLFTTKVRL